MLLENSCRFLLDRAIFSPLFICLKISPSHSEDFPGFRVAFAFPPKKHFGHFSASENFLSIRLKCCHKFQMSKIMKHKNNKVEQNWKQQQQQSNVLCCFLWLKILATAERHLSQVKGLKFKPVCEFCWSRWACARETSSFTTNDSSF